LQGKGIAKGVQNPTHKEAVIVLVRSATTKSRKHQTNIKQRASKLY
jgi:hypothetical protein